MSSYDPTSIDVQVLGFCLDIDFFTKVSNILDRDMFTREMKDVYDAIVFSHTKYAAT